VRTSGFEIDAEGVVLRGEVRGPPAGEAVVLVHGLGFTRRKWAAQVDALTGSGRRVVTYDLRGFGDSDLPEDPWTMAMAVDDLERVRAHVGLDRFHLVGHSLGGMVAFSYAVTHPHRLLSLAAISTASHSGRRASALAKALQIMSRVGAETALSDPELRAEVEAIVRSVAAITGPLLVPLRRLCKEPDLGRSHAWHATIDYSVRGKLGELPCPLLVMHGDKDPLIPFIAGFLTHFNHPGSTWIPVEGARHNLPTDVPELVNEAILEFMEAA
jgi:pimeloyl-ACP methyl ester carboxylesterase